MGHIELSAQYFKVFNLVEISTIVFFSRPRTRVPKHFDLQTFFSVGWGDHDDLKPKGALARLGQEWCCPLQGRGRSQGRYRHQLIQSLRGRLHGTG